MAKKAVAKAPKKPTKKVTKKPVTRKSQFKKVAVPIEVVSDKEFERKTQGCLESKVVTAMFATLVAIAIVCLGLLVAYLI